MDIENAVREYLDSLHAGIRNADLGELSLALLVSQTPDAQNVARTIITRAQRTKILPIKVIEQVVKEGPEIILPGYTPWIP